MRIKFGVKVNIERGYFRKMRGTPEQSGQYHEDYGREVEYHELVEKKLVNEVAWYIEVSPCII